MCGAPRIWSRGSAVERERVRDAAVAAYLVERLLDGFVLENVGRGSLSSLYDTARIRGKHDTRQGEASVDDGESKARERKWAAPAPASDAPRVFGTLGWQRK